MIIANITTYKFSNNDAIHYYCLYSEVADDYKLFPENQKYLEVDLSRVLTSEYECELLNKRDGCRVNKIGSETHRFNTIDEIHNTLIDKFKNNKIITYYNNEIFKDSLYYNVEEFKNVFVPIPNSCFKDLIPENYIIRCRFCNKTFTLEEISKESIYQDRTLITFKNITSNTDCCKKYDLEWNVIL